MSGHAALRKILMRSATELIDPCAQQLPAMARQTSELCCDNVKIVPRDSQLQRTAVHRDVLIERLREVVGAVDIAPIPVCRQASGVDVLRRNGRSDHTFAGGESLDLQ
jgi:hypothetical protein